MAAYLLAGFDTARLGGMEFAFENASGIGGGTISGTLAHRDLSPVMGTGEYTALVDAVAAGMMRPGAPALAFSTTTLRYTFTFSEETAVYFGALGTAGKNLAAALGFDYTHPQASGGSASDPYNIMLSAGDSATSSVAPFYLLELARPGPADYSRPFEVSGQTRRQVSSNGQAFSLGPRTYEERVKFSLRFNTLASTFAREAEASAPWTYEHLVKHARCHEPILFSYPAEELVYKNVRGEFDEEARKSVWQDFHKRWNLHVEGQFLGWL